MCLSTAECTERPIRGKGISTSTKNLLERAVSRMRVLVQEPLVIVVDPPESARQKSQR